MSKVLGIILAFASSDKGARIIRQAVAFCMNWAFGRFIIDRDKGRDLAVWADLADKVSEAAAVFASAVSDGEVTDDEAAECEAVIRNVLAAWADGDSTPSEYKAKVGE